MTRSLAPCLAGGMAALLAGVLLGGVPRAAAAVDLASIRHPQDGPHCEVVVRIREQGVEVRLSPNLVFLDAVLDFPREEPGEIAPSEVWALRDLLVARFATPGEFALVSIDGATPTPTVGEILVNAPDPDLLALFPNHGMRGLRKIAVTLDYPTEGLPSEVALRWRDFPPNSLSLFEDPPPLVIVVELLTPGRRALIDLSAAEPEFIWHAPPPDEVDAAALAAPAAPPPPELRTLAVVPVAAGALGVLLAAASLRRGGGRGMVGAVLALAACGTVAILLRDAGRIVIGREESPLPTPEQAVAIFKPLQRDVYRAFDFEEDGEVYDALAACVDGPLLPRIYRTVRRSLIMEEEGGAVGRVIEVRPLEVEVESIGLVEPPREVAPLVAEGQPADSSSGVAGSPPSGRSTLDEVDPRRVGFTVRCRWQVDGAVYHWGHGHFRTNEYEGRFLVIATDRGWRIAGDELLSQRRVDEPPPEAPGDAPGLPEVDEDGEFEV